MRFALQNVLQIHFLRGWVFFCHGTFISNDAYHSRAFPPDHLIFSLFLSTASPPRPQALSVSGSLPFFPVIVSMWELPLLPAQPALKSLSHHFWSSSIYTTTSRTHICWFSVAVAFEFWQNSIHGGIMPATKCPAFR